MDKPSIPLEFRLDYSTRLREGVDYLVFRALMQGVQVATVAVYYSPSRQDRPEPFLFYMGTEEGYQQHGVIGHLVRYVNQYCMEELDSPLFSGTINNDHAIKVWEKLAEDGIVEEFEEKGRRRWRFNV
jgi:GNAT superfamily N-acetyltransferase|tara:strand:- start:462 stop:845 length:384 start_codon:yes stop_codon:yes gene_type:complete